MTPFEKRIERIAAKLGPLPQKMTFVYADGRRVEVVGFLAAARQCSKGEGIVDVLGASEGLKNFILCSQCDINTLWGDEGGGDSPAEPADSPAMLDRVQSNPKRPISRKRKQHGARRRLTRRS